MANEEDSSSISEDFDENPSLHELVEHVEKISTKIRRKKENLEAFVESMKNENSINKTVLKRFHGIESDFKEGRKTKAEFKDLQKRLTERIDEVDEKVERIQHSLNYITSKELQIEDLYEEISKLSEDDQEDLVKLKYEIQSPFSEIKIKFRQSKKVKLSLLTKFKPDDLIQSVKSWEKAAETARDINRKVAELQNELEERTSAMDSIEEELQSEREKSKEHEQDLLRLSDDMKNEDDSKKEQVGLINTFRSLLDESEKLARNLEAQNTNLNQIISGEKERVSDLRNKLCDLQDQIDKEHKSNREMSLQHEHMKAGFLAATAENEGYARDMAAIRKELDEIKALQNQPMERSKKEEDEETLRDQIEELEEKLQISDKMVHAKYLETETLVTDLDKTSERVVELDSKVIVMNESITKLIEKVEVRDREVAELTELLRDTQTALESEKLAKDEYIIKCEVLEQKLALMEIEGNDARDGIGNEDMEKEIQDLRDKLEEERLRIVEHISLVGELEEQLLESEEMREYEEDIKTRSIENIVQAEIENRKLKQIVEELREGLSEKDSGIEELIAHCAVEELKLREEIAGLTNQLQIYKRDCVYKANIIERLRRKVESQRAGLGTLNEEEEEETEADLLVKAAALERKLHEERIKIMRYEEALMDLNKQCEENEETIRDKDYELSRKSAEDGKRIAELLLELESDRKSIIELDEQIENLEDILSLKEAIAKIEDESDDVNREQMVKELADMKQDYAVKKIRRRDELIQEMRQFINELRNQLKTEQERLQQHEDLISDLNDENVQDSKKIDQLTDKIAKLEEETKSQKEYIDKLTEKITEGQRLISKLEGIADRERMRVATIEQLLLQDKQEYSQHLVDAQDVKVKVDSYQTNVGEIRNKVDRINRNVSMSPRDGPESSGVLHLKGKIKAQKTVIKELKANVEAVEEKNEELHSELKDQKGKNIEQDEKIDKVLQKTLECEDLVEFMKSELELVRKRYRGLSGLPEEESPEENRAVDEEIREASQGDLEAQPSTSLFSFLDDEKENEGDDELEEGESDTVYSSEEQDEKTRASNPAEVETRQQDIIRQLRVFEKVFEKIFAEEGTRIDNVIQKFERVMQKNTELLSSLQNVRATLVEARKETERKEEQIEEMKEEFLSIKEELDDTKANNEKIRLALEEEEERTLQLSQVLTDEQVKGVTAQEHANMMQKVLEDQQEKIHDLESKLSEEMTRVSQLKESLAVEQLIKVEHGREVEILKSKVMEEQESSEQLREEVERETNARYEFDQRMNDIEEEACNRANIIEELQKDLETERRCYGIVTERLQAEQEKLVELESYLQDAGENAYNDKTLIGELRANIAKEEQQKQEFFDKLEKFERESSEKDQAIDNLMDQLGSERNKMEELVGNIDLEKMAKSTAESKLKELEDYLSRDEQIFEELRRNTDSESAKNRELSELLDREQERNSETEEKARELEKQVLLDLELFEELKNTIEQERAHNRELDALLNEKSSAFNNRDKLLSELDSELTELKTVVKREQLRNEELNEELKKGSSNESVIEDLQEMLKSQIIHSEELDEKSQKLQDLNQEQDEKIEVLEKALHRLKELSAQVSKELSDDLEAWGEQLDEPDDNNMDLTDLNDNYDYTTERDALRFKALLNNELTIKKNLFTNVEEYKNKLHENDVLLSELNEIVKSEQRRTKEVEDTVAIERQQKEELKSLMKQVENVLELKQKDSDALRADLEKVNVLYTEMVAENGRKKKEVESLSQQADDKDTKQEQFIKELRENIDKMENHLKEKEEESEMLRTYFEEEHMYAKERLQQNQELKKQVEEMEEKLKQNENEIKNLLDDKSQLNTSLEKTSETFEKQRNTLVEELKNKTKTNDENEAEIKDLRKTVEDLSQELKKQVGAVEEKLNEKENQIKNLLDDKSQLTTSLEKTSVKFEKQREILVEEIKDKTKTNDENEAYITDLRKTVEDLSQELKKQVGAVEEKLNEKENQIKNLLDDKSQLTTSLEKTSVTFEKQREILVEEIKDKTRKNNEDVKYIKELQRTVEDLSQSHRRGKDQGVKPKEKQTPGEGTKVHLKEIEDEFDSLEVELAQKDEDIAALRKALETNNNNNAQSSELQKEVDRLKEVVQEHKERSEKAANALDKARLLRELLQAQVDIKTSTVDYGGRAHLPDSNVVMGSFLSKKKQKVETVSKVDSGEVQSPPSVDGGKEIDAVDGKKKGDKEDEIEKLRGQLTKMQTAMDKERKENERVLNEKNEEIERQSKTIALIKNMYHVLQYEAKREKILQDVLPPEESSLDDAQVLFKDLENRLQSLKHEVAEKTTTTQDLKLYIDELKTNKGTDKNLLDRKENIHRLLSVQLKEKDKKLCRLENLMQNIEKIYGNKITDASTEDPETSKSDIEKNKEEIQKDGISSKLEAEESIIEAASSESMDSAIPIDEGKDSIDSPVLTQSSTDSSTPTKLATARATAQQTAINCEEIPKSGYKIRLLLYIAIAVGLAFLPQFFKLKTLKIVLVFVVTPLFFVMSSVEAKLYRKKIKEFVRRKLGAQSEGDTTVANDSQEETKSLIVQDTQNKNEEKFMEKLQDQLQQELQMYLTKKEDLRGSHDDFAKQDKRVEDLEKTIREIEKSKITEQEKNQRSYDEYIKLRGDVEELKKRRDLEEKSGWFGAKKIDTSRLDSDLSLLSVRPRSLPLWVILSVVIYHLTNLHPAAPCTVFLLMSLYAVNSWFKIRTIKTKLLNEREITREQNDELEDLTDLLEMEHKVVESQKAAMGIMQREIDNEYVSRKAKSLTLAKMIIQMKELEDMRRAIQEENIKETSDPELKAATQKVSKEKADEQIRMYVEMSRKLPEVGSLPSSEAIEDLNETVEDIATQAQTGKTGDDKAILDTGAAKKSNPKSKLVAMAALGIAAFGASLIFKYYFPALLIAMQLVIIIQLFLKHKLLQLNEQLPVTDEELKTQLNKEMNKNKANRQQIGKLRRLLDTEKSFKKSDECAKEIKKRVIDRASKRKQL